MNCPLCHAQDEIVVCKNNFFRVIKVEENKLLSAYYRVIWQQHQAEMTDLNSTERVMLMNAVCIVEEALRQQLQPDKINLMSLGNQVPHVHWHIVARFKQDAYFPQSIWADPTHNQKIELSEYALLKVDAQIQEQCNNLGES